MSSEAAAQPRATHEFLHRALHGDTAAEREVCRRLFPAVSAYAHRRLGHAAAEDFVHDVLMIVIQAMRDGRVQDAGNMASFALGVCRNLSRERARSDERRQTLFQQFGMTEADLTALDEQVGVHRAQLEDCFSQLTLRARKVIRASFCEEFADAEIAATLEVSEPNVRVIRHRSLAALRECLERPISWVQR